MVKNINKVLLKGWKNFNAKKKTKNKNKDKKQEDTNQATTRTKIQKNDGAVGPTGILTWSVPKWVSCQLGQGSVFCFCCCFCQFHSLAHKFNSVNLIGIRIFTSLQPVVHRIQMDVICCYCCCYSTQTNFQNICRGE